MAGGGFQRLAAAVVTHAAAVATQAARADVFRQRQTACSVNRDVAAGRAVGADRAAQRDKAGFDANVATGVADAFGFGFAAAVQFHLFAGAQQDATAFAHGAAGVDDTFLFDQGGEDVGAAVRGGDLAEIERLFVAGFDIDRQVGRAGMADLDLFAGGEHDFAGRRGDDAAVFDFTAEQVDTAADGRGDVALVDDAGAAVCTQDAVEIHAAAEEVAIHHVQRRGHQSADIDLRIAADQDAARVDQPDLAVGFQRAQQAGHVLPDYPV